MFILGCSEKADFDTNSDSNSEKYQVRLFFEKKTNSQTNSQDLPFLHILSSVLEKTNPRELDFNIP